MIVTAEVRKFTLFQYKQVLKNNIATFFPIKRCEIILEWHILNLEHE